MRNRMAMLLLLIVCGGMISGCIVDPDWHHHDEHHDHY